jgi:hypothetical protein
MQYTKEQFTGWHKSSESGSGENCVFQGIQQDTTGAVAAVGVYDSKQDSADARILAFRPEAWAAFVDGLTV